MNTSETVRNADTMAGTRGGAGGTREGSGAPAAILPSLALPLVVVRALAGAVAKSTDPRTYLSRIFLDTSDPDVLRLIATNGHVMARWSIAWPVAGLSRTQGDAFALRDLWQRATGGGDGRDGRDWGGGLLLPVPWLGKGKGDGSDGDLIIEVNLLGVAAGVPKGDRLPYRAGTVKYSWGSFRAPKSELLELGTEGKYPDWGRVDCWMDGRFAVEGDVLRDLCRGDRFPSAGGAWVPGLWQSDWCARMGRQDAMALDLGLLTAIHPGQWQFWTLYEDGAGFRANGVIRALPACDALEDLRVTVMPARA